MALRTIKEPHAARELYFANQWYIHIPYYYSFCWMKSIHEILCIHPVRNIHRTSIGPKFIIGSYRI